MTEFAIMSGIIAVGGMVTLWAFGWFVLGLFGQLGRAIKDEAVNTSMSDSAMSDIEFEAAHRDDMGNFEGGVGQIE